MEDLGDELRMIGDNMKQLEVSEEKALKREEVYKERITVIANKLKMTENRTEYGEKSIRHDLIIMIKIPHKEQPGSPILPLPHY